MGTGTLILLSDSTYVIKDVLNMESSISKILDISWRFGVTAASNDSDNVAKSFLQLKLRLDDGDKVKNVFTEMTIAQFYKFLHDLEKAKCNLDLLL